MPFHFCADELMMLMAAIPFLGVFVRRLHAWYLTKFPKHKANCHDHRSPSPKELADSGKDYSRETIAITATLPEDPPATFEELAGRLNDK